MSAAQDSPTAAGLRIYGDTSCRPITALQRRARPLFLLCRFACSGMSTSVSTAHVAFCPSPALAPADRSWAAPGFWLIQNLQARPCSPCSPTATPSCRASRLALCVFPVAGSRPACFQVFPATRGDFRLPLSRVSLHISPAWHNATAGIASFTCHGTRQPPLVPGRADSTPGGYRRVGNAPCFSCVLLQSQTVGVSRGFP